MLIVGITGGIGSGKTTVARIFEALGIPVYNSDVRSKTLLTTSEELKLELIKQFGPEIYSDSGIDRAYFASLIFNNKDLLARSNQIIHPFVKQDFENWVNKQASPYVLKESAILFETGIYKQLDKTILVIAPKELRIKRVAMREKIPEEAVLERVKNQWSDEKKEKLADFVIVNNEQQLVLSQVLKIHSELVQKNKDK